MLRRVDNERLHKICLTHDCNPEDLKHSTTYVKNMCDIKPGDPLWGKNNIKHFFHKLRHFRNRAHDPSGSFFKPLFRNWSE